MQLNTNVMNAHIPGVPGKVGKLRKGIFKRFIWKVEMQKEGERQRETEIFYPLASVGQIETKSLGFDSGFPKGWQASKYLGHFLLNGEMDGKWSNQDSSRGFIWDLYPETNHKRHSFWDRSWMMGISQVEMQNVLGHQDEGNDRRKRVVWVCLVIANW